MCSSEEDATAIAALVQCDHRDLGLDATVEALKDGKWLVLFKGKMSLAAAETVLEALEDSGVETVAYHGHVGGTIGGDEPTPLLKTAPFHPLLLHAAVSPTLYCSSAAASAAACLPPLCAAVASAGLLTYSPISRQAKFRLRGPDCAPRKGTPTTSPPSSRTFQASASAPPSRPSRMARGSCVWRGR
jgi:hypothetical protein